MDTPECPSLSGNKSHLGDMTLSWLLTLKSQELTRLPTEPVHSRRVQLHVLPVHPATYPTMPEELAVAAVTVLALLLVGGGGGAGAVLRAAVFISTLITLFLLGVVHAVFTAVSFTVGVAAEAHTCTVTSPLPPQWERGRVQGALGPRPRYSHTLSKGDLGSLSPTNSQVCRIGKQHGLPQVLLMLHTEDDS